ncbi:piggyBac transposable element-derived protein 4-like [Vespula squamosa]|uniref:PiggyBac transposable element-derived protein 4-like n=1 Tax=Vespula squamosa TaxID=30214 RepID=A0ABD2AF61_VESSQ
MNSTDTKTILLHCNYLRNSKWGFPFFHQTMGRNAFVKILKFLRFDEKTQRSECLKTDKFALISHLFQIY